MRIYLAARFDRRDEMRGVRTVLEGFGHAVVSRWINEADGQPDSATPQALAGNPDAFAEFAQRDLEDLRAADAVIVFTALEGGGFGGHHTEFGVALGDDDKQLIICGPRTNVFHTLPKVEWFPNWSRLAMAMAPARLTGVTR